MRTRIRLVWTAAALVVSGTPSLAQQGSVTTSGGQTIGGNLSGAPGGVTGNGSSSLPMGQGAGGTQLQGIQLTPLSQPPTLSAPTGSQRSSLDSSNFLSGYYGNPIYQGMLSNAMNQAGPGGFGMANSGTSIGGGATGGAGGAGRTGATGARTGMGGAGGLGGAGGFGGAGRQGGLGGLTGSNTYGTVVPMQITMTYPAVPRFAVPPISAPQLQTEVSSMISRSTSLIPGAANVQVLTEGNTVTLRGTVGDEDEARLLEGMTRLTPGVRDVKNELTFPISK